MTKTDVVLIGLVLLSVSGIGILAGCGVAAVYPWLGVV